MDEVIHESMAKEASLDERALVRNAVAVLQPSTDEGGAGEQVAGFKQEEPEPKLGKTHIWRIEDM